MTDRLYYDYEEKEEDWQDRFEWMGVVNIQLW